MRFLAINLILFTSLSSFAAENPVAKETRCQQNLLKGNYCNETQADIICAMVSTTAVGCAMDLVDMKQYSDIFEALEYCKFPF